MDNGFGRPVKRSVTIAGHQTSISLEPMFWRELERAAAAADTPVNALITNVDSLRLESRPAPNLTSALRQWLFQRALGGAEN